MNNDLISRSAAIAQIERRKSLLVGDKTVPVDAFIKFLKNRPTVDAEPVRHGKCDFCGRGKPIKAYTYLPDCGLQYGIAIEAIYCPNCGEKMDGKDGDNGV